MAILEQDVALEGRDDQGNPTLDLPITRLGNIEDEAEIKPSLEAGDFIPVFDETGGRAKKTPFPAALNPTAHKSTHKTGGSDAITPADIGAAPASHTHDDRYYPKSEIDTKLTGKAASNHGTHVSYSAAAPLMDGSASAGSALTVSRSDHQHPTDTSRAAAFHTHEKSEITDFPTSLPPTAHKDTHTKEGTDPITPADIGAAPASHTHDDRYYTESEVDTKLAEKAASNHGTHVSYSTAAPVMDGTAAAGSASSVARSDHRHPTDTSRASASHTHDDRYYTEDEIDEKLVKKVPSSFIQINGESNASASGENSIAVGNATASGNYSTAIGHNVVSSKNCSVSLGCDTVSSNTGSIAIGVYANNKGECSISMGYKTTVTASHAIALGHNAISEATSSIALGSNAFANGGWCLALGDSAFATKGHTVAVGATAYATGEFSVALGSFAVARYYSTAVGYYARVSGCFSTALGDNANVSSNYSTAIGHYATTANTNSIQLGDASNLSSITAKVAITVTSDERDKTDISPVESKAVDFLRKVQAIRYVWNGRSMYIPEEERRSETDNENLSKFGLCEYDREAHAKGTKKGSRVRVGVSAQNIQKALAEVYGDSSYANLVNDNFFDFDPDEIPEGVENQLAVNYEGFIPFLIQAVRELHERLEVLEKKEAI